MTDTLGKALQKPPGERKSGWGTRRRRDWLEGTPSDWLFRLRQLRGLTLKKIETESLRVAEELDNIEFYISVARLSQIENGTTVPSIYKLATLCRIYQVSYSDILRAYGIEMAELQMKAPIPGFEATELDRSP